MRYIVYHRVNLPLPDPVLVLYNIQYVLHYCTVLYWVCTQTHTLWGLDVFLVKIKKHNLLESQQIFWNIAWLRCVGWAKRVKYTGPKRETFMRNNMWWWLGEVKNARGLPGVPSTFLLFSHCSLCGVPVPRARFSRWNVPLILALLSSLVKSSQPREMARWRWHVEMARWMPLESSLATRRSDYITVFNLGHGNLDLEASAGRSHVTSVNLLFSWFQESLRLLLEPHEKNSGEGLL